MRPFCGVLLFCALALASLMTVPAAGKTQILFAQAVAYDSGGPHADSVVAADLNGDGKLDLVLANACKGVDYLTCDDLSGEVDVLLGSGDGTFQPAVTYSTGAYVAYSVAVGDLNGDGIPELVVANYCGTLEYGGCDGQHGAVSVLLGNGDGTFQPAATYDSGGKGAYSVVIGDLNGDGIPDLAVTNTYDQAGINGSVSVLLGNGDGTFKSAASYNTGGYVATSVAIGDVNGDGIPDLIVANFAQDQSAYGFAGVLLGNGDGTFQPAVLYGSGAEGAYSVALGDLNGDGILDLVVSDGGEAGTRKHSIVGVLLGNGDGTFRAAVTYVADGLEDGGYPVIGWGSIRLRLRT